MEPTNAISEHQICSDCIKIFFNFYIGSVPISSLKIYLTSGKSPSSVDRADPVQ